MAQAGVGGGDSVPVVQGKFNPRVLFGTFTLTCWEKSKE